MPLKKLVSKLSGKLDRTLSSATTASQAQPRDSTSSSMLTAAVTPHRSSGGGAMDCAHSSSFDVVAEVRPGSGQGGSLCSADAASRSSADEQERVSPRTDRVAVPARPQRSSSSAAMLASSLGGAWPTSGAGLLPATTHRALRARGKAMLRSSVGAAPGPMEHAHSLDSTSSSMDITGSLPSAGVMQLASARFARPSLPGCSSSLTDQQQQPGTPLAAAPAPAAAAAGPEEEEDNEASEDDVLVAPMSPAADADGDGADAHCHWEDGVVASWLQGIDHSELLHDDDPQEHEQLQHEAAAAPVAAASCAKAAAAGGGAGAVAAARTPAVYSSLLYQ